MTFHQVKKTKKLTIVKFNFRMKCLISEFLNTVNVTFFYLKYVEVSFFLKEEIQQNMTFRLSRKTKKLMIVRFNFDMKCHISEFLNTENVTFFYLKYVEISYFLKEEILQNMTFRLSRKTKKLTIVRFNFDMKCHISELLNTMKCDILTC